MQTTFVNDFVCGIDEAGRGPLAGPVVAACVVLDKSFSNPILDDSKKLSLKKRELLYIDIIQNAVSVGIGYASPYEIDYFNIRNATFLAMKRAWNEAGSYSKSVLIDGRDIIPGLPETQKAIIGGDGKIAAISAASIIAKVMRDWVMEIYHETFPIYKFEKNKGYGTKEHMTALFEFGPCRIHRQSFLKKFYEEKRKRESYIGDLF